MFHDDYYLKTKLSKVVGKLAFIKNSNVTTFIENMIRDGIGVSILPESIVRILNDGVVGIEITGLMLHGI